MSLACAVVTSYGIVMSADRRISVDFCKDGEPNVLRRKIITDHQKKLFPVGKYGLSYWGDSGPVPIPVLLERIIKEVDATKSLHEVAAFIRERVRSELPPKTVTSFFLCGYDGVFPDGKIVYFSTESQALTDVKIAVAVGGDLPEFIDSLLRPGLSFSHMTLQDAKEYLAFLTFTTATYQKFSDCPETVSQLCDFLVLPRP